MKRRTFISHERHGRCRCSLLGWLLFNTSASASSTAASSLPQQTGNHPVNTTKLVIALGRMAALELHDARQRPRGYDVEISAIAELGVGRVRRERLGQPVCRVWMLAATTSSATASESRACKTCDPYPRPTATSTALAVRKDNDDIKDFRTRRRGRPTASLPPTWSWPSYGATVQGIDTEERPSSCDAGRAPPERQRLQPPRLSERPSGRRLQLVAQTECISLRFLSVQGDDSSFLDALNSAIDRLRAGQHTLRSWARNISVRIFLPKVLAVLMEISEASEVHHGLSVNRRRKASGSRQNIQEGRCSRALPCRTARCPGKQNKNIDEGRSAMQHPACHDINIFGNTLPDFPEISSGVPVATTRPPALAAAQPHVIDIVRVADDIKVVFGNGSRCAVVSGPERSSTCTSSGWRPCWAHRKRTPSRSGCGQSLVTWSAGPRRRKWAFPRPSVRY